MNIVIEAIGWTGTALLVGAYYLGTTGKLKADGSLYQWLNLAGACGVGLNVLIKQAWPALAMEIIWALIAVAALVRISCAEKKA